VIHYLIVILEHDAASFCYYDIKPSNHAELIPLDLLVKTIDFAIKNGVSINFLCGNTVLPPDYEQSMARVEHMKWMPIETTIPHENAILILDGEPGLHDLHKLSKDDLNNIILRVHRNDLENLSSIIKRLIGKFKRLNVILCDIEDFDDSSFRIYEEQLADIRVLVEAEYRNHNPIELNILTDRIFLVNMNHCNAGIEHLTVAPNGRVYLCPAFYYENAENSLGDLNDQTETHNTRLLELGHAPICRNCDAYHCKRCVYLNQKRTSELNTPSHQQCVVAHLERKASRDFLGSVGSQLDLPGHREPIPELDYLDPFDLISDRSADAESREKHFAQLLSRPLMNVPMDRLLWQIYKANPALLVQLKALNHTEDEAEDRE
jgi:CXXX repeat peptide maturase